MDGRDKHGHDGKRLVQNQRLHSGLLDALGVDEAGPVLDLAFSLACMAGPEMTSGVMSSLASRSRTCRVGHDLVTACASLALTGSGRPFGPKIANQKRSSTSAGGTPASCMVGTSGMAGDAGRARHRERLDLAALDQALGRLHRRDGHRHVAGDDVADRLAAALVGHVHGLHAGLVHEHLEVEVRDAADAGGGEVHLLRHGLRIGDSSFTVLTGTLLATTSADGDAARPATASYCVIGSKLDFDFLYSAWLMATAFSASSSV